MKSVQKKLNSVMEGLKHRKSFTVFALLLVFVSLTNTASADLAGDLSNISTVITSASSWVRSTMTMFMEPPLVIFVGITIFAGVARMVKRFLRR